jgi:phosphoribosylaminoimidazolecarboxamide formyltransferase/IMP cyclohydrolase
MNHLAIRRALVSLSDKTGLEVLLEGLAPFAVEIYSTGGTFKSIQSWLATQATTALKLHALEDYLNYPEMPGGLVKTLHPRVHGGLLADLQDSAQRAHMQEQGMVAFDLCAVNLYPFENTVASGADSESCRRQIDIGGVAMLRAAAKNYPRLAVLCQPQDYARVLQEMQQNQGCLSAATRLYLAQAAFRHVLHYDAAICRHLDTLQEVPC